MEDAKTAGQKRPLETGEDGEMSDSKKTKDLSKTSLHDFSHYLTRGPDALGKKFFLGGNWKSNGTTSSVREIVETLNAGPPISNKVEVILAIPSLHLSAVKALVRSDYAVAAQDVCYYPGFGARTGELPAEMLKDFGIKWAVVGHSERRAGFGGAPGETDEVVATKTKVALEAGLSVIACIGEKLEEREAEQTLEVVLNQNLAAIAAEITDPVMWESVVIAYEPVWAIGTGLTASPEQAQEVHAAIRTWLAEHVSDSVAKAMRIIYGGSAKAANAEGLIAQPDIDGFLVGGASLKPEFVDMAGMVAAGASS